ncbi:MAG: response regulator [Desulfococcaceae bacterium]|jgi:YesN/AraC family two-component response regulator|nr:response regulator [Desulfococcaceae bacterium]
MKILIVDDSMMVRNSLKRMLEASGLPDLKIRMAPNGEKGLSLFEEDTPDILIADLLMPVLDGTEMVRQLSDIKHRCFITVLSSNFQKPVKDRLLRLGAHLFTEKPITDEKLSHILKEFEKFRTSLS